jgi:hypothetical protein
MWMTTVVAKLARMLIASCLLAVTLPLMTGCARPSITFLEVPLASSGGIGSTALIRGRVLGKHRGRHIFLYAFADGRWWVQPFASAPRTEIAKDGTWKAQIHLGTEYAALLSKGEKPPPQFLVVLPTVGKTIEAVAVTKASGRDAPSTEDSSSEKILRFSGFEWRVRTIPGDYGAKTNDYSSDNVSVDESGALHLRLSRSAHGWVCSEVHSVRSLGYGDYALTVEDVHHLEPAVMFSMFTFFERPADGDHRELAIHITRRGVTSNTNAEFSIQPAFVPTNFYHFEAPSGSLKLGLSWRPEEAGFSISRVQMPRGEPAGAWLFKTGVPRSDDTHVYINLCNYGYAPSSPTHNTEVVVKTFEFYP